MKTNKTIEEVADDYLSLPYLKENIDESPWTCIVQAFIAGAKHQKELTPYSKEDVIAKIADYREFFGNRAPTKEKIINWIKEKL